MLFEGGDKTFVFVRKWDNPPMFGIIFVNKCPKDSPFFPGICCLRKNWPKTLKGKFGTQFHFFQGSMASRFQFWLTHTFGPKFYIPSIEESLCNKFGYGNCLTNGSFQPRYHLISPPPTEDPKKFMIFWLKLIESIHFR